MIGVVEGSARTPAPVSVVIPCYQCNDTVQRAVSSVAMQTWRPAELILVDDGSDDSTADSLTALQREYGTHWVRVVSLPENRGPAGARNVGWELAGQPYVAFLDADDSWHHRKVELQVRYVLEHPEVAITGHRTRILTAAQEPSPVPQSWEARPIRKWAMLLSNRLSTSSVMLKRDLPVRFDAGQRYSEDYMLWLEILCRGYTGVLLDVELAYRYKPPWGAGGLSGRLWAMEKGELNTIRTLHSKRLISKEVAAVLCLWSLAKYCRRVVASTVGLVNHEA